ncbi:MAG: TMEM165/GDT1 family protein, partial [Nitrospira sp.]
ILVTVFLAELGDKTQLDTLMFAADPRASKLGLFAASSAALVLSSLMAVLLGAQFSQYVSPQMLKFMAGIGFAAIGICSCTMFGPARTGRHRHQSVPSQSSNCLSHPSLTGSRAARMLNS